MKKRVLFVDDEPFVLQALQRMLRTMRQEWEMTFVEKGQQALDIMRNETIDVIVSDMRMPGMNGAELLNIVMERHPRTIRLILSGHADREMILRCVGSTHQYLAKPCEPEALKATIARALALDQSLKSEKLRTLIGKMTAIPTIPALYIELLRKTQDPDVPLGELGDIITRDPGMTAKVLKVANSAFFGLRREVSTPTDAVTYLGIDTIKSLILGVEVFAEYQSIGICQSLVDRVWAHSLAVANHARRIAADAGCGHKTVQEAFVGGLLHDCGKLVLGFNFPEEYQRVNQQVTEGWAPLDAEQSMFSADHAEVGGYLLGLWGLPVPVVESIALHHQISVSTGGPCPRSDEVAPLSSRREMTPLTAVYLANAVVLSADGTPLNEDLSEPLAAELGFSDRLAVWRSTLCAPVTAGSRREVGSASETSAPMEGQSGRAAHAINNTPELRRHAGVTVPSAS